MVVRRSWKNVVVMVVPPPSPVHWTTYVQTFAVIASTIGTFVYVYFTYHIMKWAVGQGNAAVAQANIAVENHVARQDADLRRVIDFAAQAQAAADTFLKVGRLPGAAKSEVYWKAVKRFAGEATAKGAEVRSSLVLNREIRANVEELLKQVGLVEIWIDLTIVSLGKADEDEAVKMLAEVCEVVVELSKSTISMVGERQEVLTRMQNQVDGVM